MFNDIKINNVFKRQFEVINYLINHYLLYYFTYFSIIPIRRVLVH